MELSVVVPAYNESASLPAIVARLKGVLQSLGRSFEIIIVNDGSKDATEAVVDELARAETAIVPIHLARNFGKEAAIMAGLEAARGDAVVLIDADLQHPPELIGDMHAAWCAGHDVVNAVKRSRAAESFVYRGFAGVFNGLMSRVTGTDMRGATDFKLLDRQVVDALLACPERTRFFRGLVAWVGFRVCSIEFDVSERSFGQSRWSVLALVRYSLRNILSFSSFPLQVVGYIGFVTALLGGLLLIQTLVRYFSGTAAIGFTTVIALQILIGGVLLIALGVIAVYLGHIYENQKYRPIFLVRKPRHGEPARDRQDGAGTREARSRSADRASSV